jgi:dolichyl-diphosphooligosaccharide--protein glycosyltransferase
MQTEYGKPAGYDRARGREVGRKNIELTTMEEAFTSEHWIVRIFKVKPRANLDPALSAKLKKKPTPKKAVKGKVVEEPAEEARYVGCFASETSFGDKVYEGGTTGANYGLALHHAKTTGKKYFAVAKAYGDGHSFAFSRLVDSPRGNMNGGGCERPCDDQENKVCGCVDDLCTGPKPKGEEHNRRWAVYEVTAGKK